MTLSEDLLARAEAQSAASGTSEAEAASITARPQVWAVALRCIGLASLIAAGLFLLSTVFGPLLLFALLWVLASPVVVLGLFQARSPLSRITMGFGARVGLVTGLAMATVGSLFITTVMLVLRYATHSMAAFDAQTTDRIAQLRLQAAAQQPGAPLPPLFAMLDVPEFRAGLMMAGLGFSICILLGLTTAGGAFAGALRSQKRA